MLLGAGVREFDENRFVWPNTGFKFQDVARISLESGLELEMCLKAYISC